VGAPRKGSLQRNTIEADGTPRGGSACGCRAAIGRDGRNGRNVDGQTERLPHGAGLVNEIEALEERMAELLLNKAERAQRRAAAGQ
jgi:hypothetical protein